MRIYDFCCSMGWIFLFACSAAAATPAGYTETEVDWRNIQLSTSARQTWLQNRLENYVYDLERRCICPHREIRVFVIEGQVAQVEDKQSGEVITDETELKSFRTLDEYHQWLDHLWRRGADAFMVRLNPHLGYPEEINIDPTFRMVDEEIREKIVSFRLLKRMK